MINRNNYEKYFIDFLDGKLSSSEKDLLFLFLDQNPDLNEELETYEKTNLLEEEISFPDKNRLKKKSLLNNKKEENFSELCIAKIEGDLNEKEALEFNSLIKGDKQKEKELRLFELTKIVPDNSIILKDKSLLKRQHGKKIFLKKRYVVISIAASIAILVSLYFFIPRTNNNEISTEIASSMSEVKSTIKDTEVVEKNEDNTELLIAEENVTKINAIPIYYKNIDTVEKDIIVKKEQQKNEEQQISYLDPIQIEYRVEEKDLNITFGQKESLFNKGVNENIIANDDISFKGYLAKVFNKRFLDKQDKNKIEFFDIAQAGVKGINKLTGSKMSLERVYDENSNTEKTTFNSRLIAFSTPVKED